jgi:hypothetical protein
MGWAISTRRRWGTARTDIFGQAKLAIVKCVNKC